MPQRTDLYTILLSYANKHRSPAIEINGFLSFLNRYAIHYAPERPEWRVWTQDITTKFWAELNPLVAAGKCELHSEGTAGKLLMLEYYAEVINKMYENLETQAHLPFPDERTLGLKIPAEQIKAVSILLDMNEYMLHPLTTDMPVLRIEFPEEQGAALFLARHVPQRALEASLIKIQYHIQNQNNKDYYAARLSTQLQGKDVLIKDLLNQLETRPLDCLSHIQEAGEFASLFWPYFAAVVKLELKKKNEFTSADLATMQAIYFIEFFVGYYRTRTSAEKERELALWEIETKLEKPPYLFTFKDILGFTDASGHFLAEVYGQESLEKLLQEKTTKIPEDADPGVTLPPLLIFRNRFDEQVFISKSKVFPLAAKLLGEARTQIRKTISARWTNVLKEFQSELPMENDKDFERILTGYVAQIAPSLNMLLLDQKVYLVQAELERTQGGLLQYAKLFDDHGKLLPLSILLLTSRKDLIMDVKILLPFWYSIPIISAIIGFFRRLKAGKKKKAGREEAEKEPEEQKPRPRSETTNPEIILKRAATQFQAEKVPAGQTVDQYLTSLEKRWRKILDADAHKQMSHDVQTLVKKKLQRMMSIRTSKMAGIHTITEMADSIIFETPTLMELDSTDSMKLYISLCISKILKNP
jgi:hypothetical protein